MLKKKKQNTCAHTHTQTQEKNDKKKKQTNKNPPCFWRDLYKYCLISKDQISQTSWLVSEW